MEPVVCVVWFFHLFFHLGPAGTLSPAPGLCQVGHYCCLASWVLFVFFLFLLFPHRMVLVGAALAKLPGGLRYTFWVSIFFRYTFIAVEAADISSVQGVTFAPIYVGSALDNWAVALWMKSGLFFRHSTLLKYCCRGGVWPDSTSLGNLNRKNKYTSNKLINYLLQ